MADVLVGTVAALETSVQGSVINRIITGITALSLASITTRVHFRKFPYDKDLTWPACIVSPAPELVRDTEGSIGQNVVHYSFFISLIRAANRDLVNGADEMFLWRQSVRQLFQGTRPTWAAITGASLRKTTVRSGEPFIRDAALLMIDAQYLVLDIEMAEDIVI